MMETRVVCDRCKIEVRLNANREYPTPTLQRGSRILADLCEACWGELHKWLLVAGDRHG